MALAVSPLIVRYVDRVVQCSESSDNCDRIFVILLRLSADQQGSSVSLRRTFASPYRKHSYGDQIFLTTRG